MTWGLAGSLHYGVAPLRLWPVVPMSDNVIRLLGRYSAGLRLAAEYGPSSGVVHEYALKNTPQGSGALGRWIDRTFLGLRTWDNVRQRIQTTRGLLDALLKHRRAAGLTTCILDVAAGTGRYLRELAREQSGDDLVIMCHDRDPRQVMHGRKLAADEGLQRITFSVGDATDESSYLTNQDPDIALAIGLFPYLHRDDAVRTVMRLIYTHLSHAGCCVCTTLTRPPAGLADWDGNPFAPRPAIRSPERIAEWLRSTGFTHIDQTFSQPNAVAVIGWKFEY
jgi:SAM-dependent methyltransferase